MQTPPHFLAGVFYHTLQKLDSLSSRTWGRGEQERGQTLAALCTLLWFAYCRTWAQMGSREMALCLVVSIACQLGHWAQPHSAPGGFRLLTQISVSSTDIYYPERDLILCLMDFLRVPFWPWGDLPWRPNMTTEGSSLSQIKCDPSKILVFGSRKLKESTSNKAS